MKLIHHKNASDFLKTCGSLLERNEAENNLLLGLTRNLVKNKNHYSSIDPLFFTIEDNNECLCACLQTPPNNLVLYGLEKNDFNWIDILCGFLIENEIKIPGILAPVAIAEKFVDRYSAQTSLKATIEIDEMIYKIEGVNNISISPGKLRQATIEDFNIIKKWLNEFYKQALPNSPTTPQDEGINRSLSSGCFYFWEDGNPVSMAAWTRPTKNGTTISYVYTPNEFRKKGYASSCVAHLTRILLENYKYCTLFTDLSNPTSNKIYETIGYKPICRMLQIKFS